MRTPRWWPSSGTRRPRRAGIAIERHRAEEALRRSDDAEREAAALRSVTHLANAAAHEINNPLSVIVGRLELLRRDLTPEQQGRLAQVVDASRQIAKIIAHMGRLTRLETLDDLPASPMLDLQRSSETPKP
jgi:signal transduction histidine kinase